MEQVLVNLLLNACVHTPEGTSVTLQGGTESAKDALKWAAYTYVIAALSSLATLLYYIMIYLGRRD